MKFERALLSLAIVAGLASLAGCKPNAPASSNATNSASAAAEQRQHEIASETADQFIARVN